MPLFDPRPKSRREDLYDREEELRTLLDCIKRREPLVLVLGLRRTGKTSLLRVGLAEAGVPGAIVDCRVFEERIAVSYAELLRAVEDALSDLLRRAEGLRATLEKIRGISIAGFKVELQRGRSRASIAEVLDAIDQWASETGQQVVVAFDEAQELAKVRGARLLPIIAHCYDYSKSLTLVLTGSQVGFVYRFLRLHDPSSPMYGRSYAEVKLGRFTREQSIDFLERGFAEHGLSPPRSLLEEAVDKLDGVPGWLTMLGYEALHKGLTRSLILEVLDKASELALKELNSFLKLRAQAAERYKIILRAVAEGFNAWSTIKKYLEVSEGRRISDSDLAMLLKNLVDAGFLEKAEDGYRIPDPILAYAITRARP